MWTTTVIMLFMVFVVRRAFRSFEQLKEELLECLTTSEWKTTFELAREIKVLRMKRQLHKRWIDALAIPLPNLAARIIAASHVPSDPVLHFALNTLAAEHKVKCRNHPIMISKASKRPLTERSYTQWQRA